MTTILKMLALALALVLTGCASSGFAVATNANTSRATTFQDSLLIQAANDLTAINDCYLNARGYARVSGTANAVNKVGEPVGDASTCTVMAMGLRTQANMLTAFAPFLGEKLMSRVPAALEEIAADLAKFGVKASLLKFGVEKVSDVITSGQAANAQIAQAGIEAASKPPLVVEKPFVVQVPMGSAPLPTAPAAPVTTP